MQNRYEQGFQRAIDLVIKTTEEAGFFFIDEEEREEYIALIKSIKCPTESNDIRALATALQELGTRSK